MRIGVIGTGKRRATRSGYGLLRVKGYHDNCRDNLLAAWGVSVYAPGSHGLPPGDGPHRRILGLPPGRVADQRPHRSDTAIALHHRV